jgi:hypothetical protein
MEGEQAGGGATVDPKTPAEGGEDTGVGKGGEGDSGSDELQTPVDTPVETPVDETTKKPMPKNPFEALEAEGNDDEDDEEATNQEEPTNGEKQGGDASNDSFRKQRGGGGGGGNGKKSKQNHCPALIALQRLMEPV